MAISTRPTLWRSWLLVSVLLFCTAVPALAVPPGWTDPALPDPLYRRDMELVGPVKSIEVRAEVLGIAGNSNNVVETLIFDSAGRLLKVESRERDLLAEVRHYEHQPQAGLVIVKIEENATVDRRVIDLKERERFTCELDKQGRILHVERIDWMGEDSGSWDREYDPNGRVLVEREMNKQGELRSLRMSNFAGPTQGKTSYFDAKFGEAVDLEKAEEVHEIEYDAAGRKVAAIVTQPHHLPTAVSFIYDDAGRLVDEIHRRSGQVVEEHHWIYDERGNPLTHAWLTVQKTSLHETFSYTYDAQGNWTLRRHESQTIALGEPLPMRIELTRRAISYF